MNSIEKTTYAIMANGFDFISKWFNAGKPSKESEEAIFEEKLEEERKKVTPLYDTQGKIVRNYQ